MLYAHFRCQFVLFFGNKEMEVQLNSLFYIQYYNSVSLHDFFSVLSFILFFSCSGLFSKKMKIKKRLPFYFHYSLTGVL